MYGVSSPMEDPIHDLPPLESAKGFYSLNLVLALIVTACQHGSEIL